MKKQLYTYEVWASRTPMATPSWDRIGWRKTRQQAAEFAGELSKDEWDYMVVAISKRLRYKDDFSY